MMQKVFKHSFFFALLFFINTFNSNALDTKLAIGIVVDQMRFDYLHRFDKHFTEGGFKRFFNEGFVCYDAHYNYAPTFTGPGHASIYTGTTPSSHGIIANDWYDKYQKRNVYCSEDKSVETVGNEGKAGKMSPKNMKSRTVSDALKLSNNHQSKVIGVSLKDRGSILPAGHAANAAYWYDAGNGAFITSTYYMNDLPKWVKDFNAEKKVSQYLSKDWNTLLPIENYTQSASDDSKFETKFPGEVKSSFPHKLADIRKKAGLGLISYTPFGNSLVLEMAKAAIENEKLGKNPSKVCDFLAMSFSSTDYIGHQFGPQSKEVEDTYIRLDRELEEFFKYLDNSIGKGNYLVFLTADHAVAENTGFLEENKLPGRVYKDSVITNNLNEHLNKSYNLNENWIENYSNEQYFFDKSIVEKHNLDLNKLREKAADFLNQQVGIAAAYPAQFLQYSYSTEEKFALLQKGYNFKMSGDVALILEPSWMDIRKIATTHGSAYAYDTHVPIMFFGTNISKGKSYKKYQITDIAPTVSQLLKISYPDACTGNVIKEVFGK
jgi:predicted AlkP superfamily pyrophosphatase or phosphodiesterase